MRRTVAKAAFVVAALTLVFTAREARATGVAIDLLAGYGFDDAYRIGFGIRGGFTLPQNLYVGGAYVLHRGRTGVRTERSTIAAATPMYLGSEAGYDFQVAELTLRPYLGAGYALVFSSTGGPCSGGSCRPATSSTDGTVALWPGAAVIWTSGGISVGADVRYVAVLGSSYGNALAAFGTAGLRF